MKTEFIEILENKLEDFVGEVLNDKQKRVCKNYEEKETK